MNLLRIAWIFIKVGLLTFGGGYAMLPILQRELIDNHDWINEKELTDAYALAQSLPGLIFVNTAVLLVRPRFGLSAGIVAAFAVALPSCCVILVIAALLMHYTDLPLVQHAFAGIRIAVAATVVQALWRFIKNGIHDLPAAILALMALVLTLLNLVSPVWVVLIAALLGFVLQTWRAGRKGAGQ